MQVFDVAMGLFAVSNTIDEILEIMVPHRSYRQYDVKSCFRRWLIVFGSGPQSFRYMNQSSNAGTLASARKDPGSNSGTCDTQQSTGKNIGRIVHTNINSGKSDQKRKEQQW